MAVSVRETTFAGQPAVVLESDRARLVALPRVGGKIASLIDKATGDELLWRNPERGYREPVYDTPWEDYDGGGWEDCLPNLTAGPYPEAPWRDIPLPAHGEVWALPWEAAIGDEEATLAVQGVRLPYRFEKSIRLDGARVRLHHRIINPCAFPIRYLWATHPLFQARPGMRIELPAGARVRIDSTVGGRLGDYLAELDWPETRDRSGAAVRLDRIGGPELGYADKLYTTEVSEGWCGLHDPASGRALALTFDPAKLPYIGVWVNQGGFPSAGTPHYNVALEPTSAYPDDLAVGYRQGTVATIGPRQTDEWAVDLTFGVAGSARELATRSETG